MTRIALLGAGGKMGFRITNKIKDLKDYSVRYVEIAPAAIERLKGIGVTVTPQNEAVRDADVVILAVPDVIISKVSAEIIPLVKPGAMILGLDPAAAYAEVMPARDGISFFVTHPCHPSVFGSDPDIRAVNDYFGGIASMDIVCALYRGPASDYAKGEAIARVIFSPVRRSFKITIEQMAILEPALVETFALTLVGAMTEAVDEVAKMGVPADVAKSFLWGHVRTEMAAMFGVADFTVSDGAKQAMAEARDIIFKPDWKKNVFDVKRIKETVRRITSAIAR
jgi:D-apionate oxidoisomerase